MLYPEAKIFVVSDTAYSVEFGDEISQAVAAKVAAFTALLDADDTLPLLEIIPSYRAVLVMYNPLRTNAKEIAGQLKKMSSQLPQQGKIAGQTVEIPVCYGGAYGPDLAGLAAEKGLSEQEVIEIHSSAHYPVYMMGFMPGFAYLGGLDKRIAAPRLSIPRIAVNAGSVGIAGEQTGIYPLKLPGGWRLIGRTPLALFDKQRPDPFLLKAGNTVRFVPINEQAYLDQGGEPLD